MVQAPMPGDRLSIAQPDTLMALDVIEQAHQCADPAGTSNDAPVQADGHHARPAFAAQSIQPVEGIAAIGEEIVAGCEVAAALQAAVVAVEGMRNHQMRPSADSNPVGQVVVVGVAVVQKAAGLYHESTRVGAGPPSVPPQRSAAYEPGDDLDVAPHV